MAWDVVLPRFGGVKSSQSQSDSLISILSGVLKTLEFGIEPVNKVFLFG